KQDLDVKSDTPVLDVIKVAVNAFPDGSISPVSVYLRPSGQSRADLMLHHISRDLFPEFLHEKRPFRSGTDKAHIPFQNIEKLRQLVNACPSHKSADPGHPGIVLYCPRLLLLRLRLKLHGPEFVHPECP